MVQLKSKSYLENFHNIISESLSESKKHTILLVDDEINNLQLLKRTLRQNYNILTAENGEDALKVVDEFGNDISLIISDQRMPAMTGTDFFTHVVEKYPHIINMLLTGQSDMETLIDSVNRCNVFQYILKPFDTEELKAIVQNGIEVFELASSRKRLLDELKELFYTTIKSISSALDAKDNYTHGHSLRVTMYSLMIAKELGIKENALEEIETAGLLHDIGKIGIPENILCKPGQLSGDEFVIIKTHPDRGKTMLKGIKKLEKVSIWLHSHHEKWDGKGYPNGLKGEDIPLESRIIAIADAYDAMTSTRSYRKALSHEVAVGEIQKCSGQQFDPVIVEAFLRIEKDIEQAQINTREYYEKYSILWKFFSKK